MDNFTDMLMLQGTETVRRPMVPPPRWLLAEHGFSCLLTIGAGAEEHTVLMDASIRADAVLQNMRLLQADPAAIEAVVLSHGHFDHAGGLPGLLSRMKPGTSLHMHPDAFLERRINLPVPGSPFPLPTPDEHVLRAAGGVPAVSRSPVAVAGGLALTTGEVPRRTAFERGMPGAEALVDGSWSLDSFRDDQGLVVNLRDRGLVVVTGCGHAGVINTARYARELGGTDRVHAVLGGFHLTGPAFEAVVGPTIAAMRELDPRFVVPMHCTGWERIARFTQEMPDEFVLNTVGTTYAF
jgi:7,8-dihydropterin-6-yl-methyl-4-(beta-D-ribofuranosyl)aminobenzene 5'-phosphate synthase